MKTAEMPMSKHCCHNCVWNGSKDIQYGRSDIAVWHMSSDRHAVSSNPVLSFLRKVDVLSFIYMRWLEGPNLSMRKSIFTHFCFTFDSLNICNFIKCACRSWLCSSLIRCPNHCILCFSVYSMSGVVTLKQSHALQSTSYILTVFDWYF